MKILLFTLEYPPFFGGVANYYYNLVKNWSEKNGIGVLNNNDGSLLSKWIIPRWLPAVWKLWYYTKRNKISHILVGQILPLGIAALKVNFLTGVKYSIFLHGMDIAYTLRSGRKKYITRLILGRAQNIICANSYAAKIVKENYPSINNKKIHIVNPGVENPPPVDSDLAEQIKKKFDLNGKTVLLSLSRLVKRKGFDDVIEIFPEVRQKVDNLAYIIAGTGPDEDFLKKKAAGNPDIIFTGAVDDKQKWTWFNLSDFFVMPARDIDGDLEGFGIAYLEANMAGKPVVATRSGGVGDAVVDNLNGLLVSPDDKNELAGAVIRLATDKIFSAKLGEQGRIRAKKDFNWPGQTQKIYNIIK